MKPPTSLEIDDYARTAAQVVVALRDSDPVRAARIAATAQRRCDAMYAAQRAARSS